MWLPVAPAGDPLFRLLYNPSIKLLIPGICLLEPSRFLDLYTQPNPIKAQLCNTLNADRPGHAHLRESSFWTHQLANKTLKRNNLKFSQESQQILRMISLNLLQQSPYLHQRTKLLTFCTNTRPHYFLGTVSPRTSTAIVHQLDKSVDNLWAHAARLTQMAPRPAFARSSPPAPH